MSHNLSAEELTEFREIFNLVDRVSHAALHGVDYTSTV